MVLLDHDFYSLLNFGQHPMQVASYFSFGHVHLGHRLDHSSSNSPSHGQLVTEDANRSLSTRSHRAHQHDRRGRLIGTCFVLDGNRERLGFDAFGHGMVHHHGVAVLVGLEDASRHGSAFHGNDPQLV